jgi:hypothetical protein
MYLYFTLCRDTESSLKQSTGKPVLRGHHLGQRKSGLIRHLKLFIDDDFILELVRQTNSYAEIKVNDDENVKENSWIKK